MDRAAAGGGSARDTGAQAARERASVHAKGGERAARERDSVHTRGCHRAEGGCRRGRREARGRSQECGWEAQGVPCAVGMCVLACSRSFAELAVGNACIGAGMAAAMAGAGLYLSDISTPRNRAQTTAPLLQSALIGFAIGPALGGLLGEVDEAHPLARAVVPQPRGLESRELLHHRAEGLLGERRRQPGEEELVARQVLRARGAAQPTDEQKQLMKQIQDITA